MTFVLKNTNSYFHPLFSFLGKGTPRGHKISDYFEVSIFMLSEKSA